MLSKARLQELLQKEIGRILENSRGILLYDQQTKEEVGISFDERGVGVVLQTNPNGDEVEIRLQVKVQVLA